MKSHEQQELRVLLSELDSRERRELSKTAARRRQEAQAAQQRGISYSRSPSHDEVLYDLLKQRRTSGAIHESVTLIPRVVGIGAGICRVETSDGIRECRVHPELRCRQQTSLAVGDLVELAGDRIMRVLSRRNRLSRPEPGNPHRERVMAANLDLAVIVVSGGRPGLHPGLIDRILLALEERGIPAAVCLNKIDLFETADERDSAILRLAPFKELGIPVVLVSASSGEGIAELRELLGGKTSVFLGHSGVGKSSLVNALAGSESVTDSAKTGEVRAADGRGRHTTTGSSLHCLAHGISVIDTPGVREFGLSEVDEKSLPSLFPEFRGFSAHCRFRDCRHLEEPDCAVCEAVRDGRIPRSRYQQYRRILNSLKPEEAPREFVCIGCGAKVPLEAVGTTQRNHCPACLWSRHLDLIPGDRAAACGGAMEPISVWVRKGGEWAILHRCGSCGVIHANRVAGDDNEIKLLSLAVKPLSQPPFPLDRLGLSESRS